MRSPNSSTDPTLSTSGRARGAFLSSLTSPISNPSTMLPVHPEGQYAFFDWYSYKGSDRFSSPSRSILSGLRSPGRWCRSRGCRSGRRRSGRRRCAGRWTDSAPPSGPTARRSALLRRRALRSRADAGCTRKGTSLSAPGFRPVRMPIARMLGDCTDRTAILGSPRLAWTSTSSEFSRKADALGGLERAARLPDVASSSPLCRTRADSRQRSGWEAQKHLDFSEGEDVGQTVGAVAWRHRA